MRFYLFVSVILVVMGLSCDLFNNEQGDKIDELIPLEMGNYWDYHRWYISSNIADTIREEIVVQHELMLSGKPLTIYGYQQVLLGIDDVLKKATRFEIRKEKVISRIYGLDTPVPDHHWLRGNGKEGILSYGGISQTDTLILKSTQYKYPGTVGDEYEFPMLSYSSEYFEFSIQDTITIEIVGTNETFTSRIATYKNCYLYKFSEISKNPVYFWDHYVYIKPGIGIVAVDTKQHYSGGEDPLVESIGQWVLINYQL